MQQTTKFALDHILFIHLLPLHVIQNRSISFDRWQIHICNLLNFLFVGCFVWVICCFAWLKKYKVSSGITYICIGTYSCCMIWTSKLSIQINIKSSKFLSFDFLRRPVKKDNFLKESKVVMNWESKMPSPAFLLEILLHFFLQTWNGICLQKSA